MLGTFVDMLYGQKLADPVLIRIGLNIVRAMLRVDRTAPRLHGIDGTRINEHESNSQAERSSDSESPNHRNGRGADENLQFFAGRLAWP